MVVAKRKYYAGIGSRETPTHVLEMMTHLAVRLGEDGYILRSGGAKGADNAFARGAPAQEIFKSHEALPWAHEMVKTRFLPTDRGGFDHWNEYTKGLLARNMMQILGKNGDTPVDFVVCWTKSAVYTDSSAGGTGYAIRCALGHGIRVYNLLLDPDYKAASLYLKGKGVLRGNTDGPKQSDYASQDASEAV